jgi:hypothetical protein
MNLHARAFVVCTLCASAAWGQAGDKNEADKRFNQGVALYKSGDLAAALVEFKKAYEIAPNFRVLYNIGQLYAQVADNANAVRAYQKYLNDGGTNVPAARRAQVQAEIRRLMAGVAKVSILSDTPGVELSVDDNPVGNAPLGEAVLVNPGKHRVTATKQGHPPVTKPLSAKGGESLTVVFDFGTSQEPALAPAADKPKEAAPEPERAAPREDRTSKDKSSPAPAAHGSFPVVPWVVTGALGVGTIVTGIVARGAVSGYEDKKASFGITRSELEDAQGSARTWVYVTAGLGAATVIMGGLSLYWTLSASPQKSTALAFGPGSVIVRGRF